MLQALATLPMTSKELRKQRRREEHKARKEANRNTSCAPVTGDDQMNIHPEQAVAPANHPRPVALPETLDLDDPESVTAEESSSGLSPYAKFLARRAARKASFEAETAPGLPLENVAPELLAPTPDHTERNRQNAQFSTGPKTPEGKAQASQNAFRHGLASNRFLVLNWESTDDFLDLLNNLRTEHRPATQTEALLVEKMAEHFWLSQRALRLQYMCFRMDVPLCDQPKDLALFIRYGTTHDSAFHKCLTEFAKLRAAQHKIESGFVSQKRQEAAEIRKQELHAARVAVLTSKRSVREPHPEHKSAPTAAPPVFCAAEQPWKIPSVPLERTETPARVSSQAA